LGRQSARHVDRKARQDGRAGVRFLAPHGHGPDHGAVRGPDHNLVDRTTWLIKKLTPALEMGPVQREQYLQHLARIIKTSAALAGRERISDRIRDLCDAGLRIDGSPVVKEVWATLKQELGEEDLLH